MTAGPQGPQEELRKAFDTAYEPIRLTLEFAGWLADRIDSAESPEEMLTLSRAVTYMTSMYLSTVKLAISMTEDEDAQAVSMYCLHEGRDSFLDAADTVVQAELNAVYRLGAPDSITGHMAEQVGKYYKERYKNDRQKERRDSSHPIAGAGEEHT